MIFNTHLNNEFFLSFLLSLYEVIAINVNLDIIKGKNGGSLIMLINDYIGSFHAFSIIHFFEWYCFYKIIKLSIPYIKKNVNNFHDYLCIGIPAILLSLSMIIGFSFRRKHSLELFWGSSLQILKSLTAFTGYLPLFISIIICLFLLFDYIIYYINDEMTYTKKNRIICILYDRPFQFTFFLLVIVNLPYIIFSYPGSLFQDPAWQIKQMINAYTLDSDNGLTIMLDKIKLHNHHPILHTIIINIFIFIGKITTDSYNVGLFLYTLFQSLCVVSSISCVIYIIIKKLHVHPVIAFTLLVYYVFHPNIQQIMTVCTKDSFYSAVFLFFISVSFTKVINCKFKYQNIFLLLSAICIILFRNEGIFVVLSVMGYWLLFCDAKLSLVYPVCATGVFILVHFVAFPFFDVTPGSIREALSIPFQQTARYVKLAGDEITDDEKVAISKIINYDKLVEKYNSDCSDSVKNTFNEKATKSDLLNYAFVWWEMLKKHPAIYVEAVLDNKYDYFYPSDRLGVESRCELTQDMMTRLNKIVPTGDFGYPKSLDYWRNNYFSLRKNIIRLPIIGITYNTAFYIWILLIWFSFCVKKKTSNAILLIMPFLFQLLANMAGPTNGYYFRYTYTYVLGLLPAILYGMAIIRLDVYNELENC